MTEVFANMVTTIIPVYNRPEMIRRAVDSVLAQIYRPIEIIIVDDGSTDQTPEMVDALEQRYPDELHVIHQENGGPGLAREAGRQIARGEFIQYLDSDDWLLPNKFTDQVAALRQHSDCDIAYGVTRLVNERGEILAEPSKDTGVVREYLFPALLVDRWWHTHTPLYTRRISDLAGAWPRQRPEDWDLEARMGAFRPKLVHCGTVVSCHLDHDSDNRVTNGDRLAYLQDEAWFLPRLYECGLKAGVPPESVEVQRLFRWIFLCARQLVMLGAPEPAERLLVFAIDVNRGRVWDMRLFRVAGKWFGWSLVKRLCRYYEYLRRESRS